MCQAYEGERRFMQAMDDFVTMKGWAAHRDGLPREYNNPLHDEAFFHGYDSRASNSLVPWAITKEFRERRQRDSGQRCYNDPTKAQADAIA